MAGLINGNINPIKAFNSSDQYSESSDGKFGVKLLIESLLDIIQEQGYDQVEKKISKNLSKLNHEEKAQICKIFSKQLHPSFKMKNSLISKPVYIQQPINEKHFKDLECSIIELVKKSTKIGTDLDQKIKLITGTNEALNPNDPAYEEKKKKAASYFDSYKNLFNSADDLLICMKELEGVIRNLEKDVIELCENFINQNNNWLDFFVNKFAVIIQEHQYVDEKVKAGNESLVSRWWSNPIAVKAPAKNLIPPSHPTEYTPYNYSSLFTATNDLNKELGAFSEKVQKHLNEVSGTRKGWTQTNPHFEDFKSIATDLPKQYAILAQSAETFYSRLLLQNHYIQELKMVLSKNLRGQMDIIITRKNLLFDQMHKYELNSIALDRTLNSKTRVHTIDLKSFKENGNEKYPLQSEAPVKGVNETFLD